MTALDVFVAEGNVEIYLSKLQRAWSAEERDALLRLLIAEEDQMGRSREHLLNGQRRVWEGRARVRKQQELVARLPTERQAASREALILQTLEATQTLLEAHLTSLRIRFNGTKV